MINKSKEVLSLLERGPQYRTKMREGQNGGSRHIRHMVENSLKAVERMLNPDNEYPNPCDEMSKGVLEACKFELKEVCSKLKKVNDKK